jgi:pimeloyl-ACP methyl ester carboxylesterase
MFSASEEDAMLKATIAFSLLFAATLRAQSGAMQQDSTLNNLAHAPGYRTSSPGTIPEVVRGGNGPVDLLLIPGWGFGAEVFESFMRANEARYRMVAVTLPGFAGTAAPPMPPPGTSYADATWTRAAEEAIAGVIRSEGLRKPVVLGHFIVGTQLAFRLALDHPDLVGGLVIVGGEPMRFVPSRRDSTGKTPMSRDERTFGVDLYLAQRWFKTVTKATFDTNNYRAPQYSRDAARAIELWKKSSAVPLPVMIRYLCEYSAMDLTDEFARVPVPTRVLIPGFTPEILSDPKQKYAKQLFVDSWENVRAKNPLITLKVVPDSRVFVTDDRPDAVIAAIAEISAVRVSRHE